MLDQPADCVRSATRKKSRLLFGRGRLVYLGVQFPKEKNWWPSRLRGNFCPAASISVRCILDQLRHISLPTAQIVQLTAKKRSTGVNPIALTGQLIAKKECGCDPDGRPSAGATTRDQLPG